MVDDAKYFEAIFHILRNPKMKFIVVPISWVIKPLTKLIYRIPFVQTINVIFEIDKLERQKKIIEARNLRHSWLKKPRYSSSAELLVSEANDLLFNLKDFTNALKAYEKAIKTNPHYSPIDMYYGASCASVLSGNTQKAEEYYYIFLDWWDKFMKDPQLKESTLKKYSSCKKWLESSLNIN